MSTRSTISIEIGDNRYESIYCHGDGYLSHNGVLLVKYYNTPEKVRALIDLGDISYLGKNFELPEGIDPLHSSETTIAYERDYGEEPQKARIMSLRELDRAKNGSVYVYIFTKEAEWKYFHVGHLDAGLLDLKNDVDALLASDDDSDDKIAEDGDMYDG